MSLTASAMISALWILLRIAIRQLAGVIIFFWLAAILSPADLGVAAAAVTLPLLFVTLCTSGFRDVIIQRPELTGGAFETAVTLNLLTGAAICLGLAASAPAMPALFGDPRLFGPALVASAIPLAAGALSPIEAFWERNFRHRRATLVQIVGAALGALVAVGVVMLGHSLYGLVAFQLSSQTITALVYWIFLPERPALRLTGTESRRQLRFAAPILISQTISAGNQRIVEFMLGVMLGPTAIAYFRFGANFVRLLNQIFINPMARVLLPAFARSRQSPERNLTRVLVVNSVVLCPVFLFSGAVLPEVVPGIFGAEWTMAGWLALILCYGVFTRLFGVSALPLLVAQGKADWSAVQTIAGLVVTVVLVWFGAQWGVLGGTIGFSARGLLMVPLTLYILWRALGIGAGAQLRATWPFVLLAFAIHLPLLALTDADASKAQILTWVPIKAVASMLAYYLGLRFLLPRFAPEQHRILVEALPGRIRRLSGL